jgi:hypothetical protein
MSNIAVTYSDLGRHNEALALGERVLEFRRRVLPERLKAQAEAMLELKVYFESAEHEAEQGRVAAAAAAVRAFRRRCLQTASAACMFVLLLLLHRAGRLPLRMQRLLAALLLWLRRR